MQQETLQKAEFLQNVFDTIPALIFIVDDDVQIFYLNSTASQMLGATKEFVYKKRGGEALHCIHSTDVPEGCGRSESCKSCIIRNSVYEAISGNKVYRKNARMELCASEDVVKEVNLLVTTAPFKYEGKNFALLILEDVSELIQLRSIIPICANCKKIRNDENFFETVETYFETHLNVDFSHTICKECRKILYPETVK